MKKMTMIGTLVLGCAAALGNVQAHAQTDQDKQFLMTASESDMAEIKLSQLALDKSSSTSVKAYAQKMITDHNMLEQQMKPFADKWGVPPATALNPDHQAIYDKLSGLSGKDFDAAYADAMSSSHHMALDAFKTELSTTQDKQFKKTVMAGEKVVAEHTRMADHMAHKKDASGSMKSM